MVQLNLFLPGAERPTRASLTAQPTGGACLCIGCSCTAGGRNIGIAWTKCSVIDGADGGVYADDWAGIRRIVIGYP